MATATAEPQMVSVPSADIVFLSRRSDLVLNMERDRPIFDRGERVGMEEGKRLGFSDSRLVVPRGDKAYVVGTRGERIPAADVLRFLEGDEEKNTPPHKMFGNREEGFWRHIEPAPAPSDAENGHLLELAEEQDAEGLEAFIAQERAGWGREQLITIAQGSLDRIHARSEPAAPAKPKD